METIPQNHTTNPTVSLTSHYDPTIEEFNPFACRTRHIIVYKTDINNLFGQWEHSLNALTMLLFFQNGQPGQKIRLNRLGDLYQMTYDEVKAAIEELVTAGYIEFGGAA